MLFLFQTVRCCIHTSELGKLAPRTAAASRICTTAVMDCNRNQPHSTDLPRLTAKQILVVLVGIPGSGKSTFAQNVIEDAEALSLRTRWQRISQDALGSRQECISVAEHALEAGDHLLVDRCNFNTAQRAHWLNLRGASCTHRIAIFHAIPPAEAFKRVWRRPLHEGGVDSQHMTQKKVESIVSRMQKDLRPPTVAEGFHEVHMYPSHKPDSDVVLRQRLITLLHEAEELNVNVNQNEMT